MGALEVNAETNTRVEREVKLTENKLRTQLIKELKILKWAAMHHPDFAECYLIFPVDFNFYRSRHGGYRHKIGWCFEVIFGRFDLFIPWKIERAYLIANNRGVNYEDLP